MLLCERVYEFVFECFVCSAQGRKINDTQLQTHKRIYNIAITAFIYFNEAVQILNTLTTKEMCKLNDVHKNYFIHTHCPIHVFVTLKKHRNEHRRIRDIKMCVRARERT